MNPSIMFVLKYLLQAYEETLAELNQFRESEGWSPEEEAGSAAKAREILTSVEK